MIKGQRYKFIGLLIFSFLLTLTLILAISPVQSQAKQQAIVPVQKILSQIRGRTRVPIFLPSRVPFSGPVYFPTEANANGYTVSFDTVQNCTANACIIGSLSAQRGGQFQTPTGCSGEKFKRIQLPRRMRGIFIANVGCGASAYSLIEWQYQGVLYDVGIKGGDEVVLRIIANSAIENGVR